MARKRVALRLGSWGPGYPLMPYVSAGQRLCPALRVPISQIAQEVNRGFKDIEGRGDTNPTHISWNGSDPSQTRTAGRSRPGPLDPGRALGCYLHLLHVVATLGRMVRARATGGCRASGALAHQPRWTCGPRHVRERPRGRDIGVLGPRDFMPRRWAIIVAVAVFMAIVGLVVVDAMGVRHDRTHFECVVETGC